MKIDITSSETSIAIIDRRFCRVWPAVCRWRSLDLAARQLLSFLSYSTLQEQVSLITFASDLDIDINPGLCGRRPITIVESELSTDIGITVSALDNLLTRIDNGNGHISEGITAAAAELTSARARPRAEKVMYVVADGPDQTGTLIAAAGSAAALGIKINTITLSSLADQAIMQSVATIGSGTHSHAATEAQLLTIFQNLALTI